MTESNFEAAVYRLLDQESIWKYARALVTLEHGLESDPVCLVTAFWNCRDGLLALTTDELVFCTRRGKLWGEPISELGDVEEGPDGGIRISFDDAESATITPARIAASASIVQVVRALRSGDINLARSLGESILQAEQEELEEAALAPDEDDEAGTEAWLNGNYMGGHPAGLEPIKNAQICIHEQGVSVWSSSYGPAAFEFEAEDVIAIDVDGPTDVQRRVTAPRVLALGVFAFAVPKRERLSYLVVTTREGEAIFQVHGATAIELRARLQPVVAALAEASDVPESGGLAIDVSGERTVRDRLEELQALFEDGLIDPDEFADRRRSILDDL